MNRIDPIKTKNAILTQPKHGHYNLCITQPDGTFVRYEISRNDVCEMVIKGASMAYRHAEEMS